MPADWRMRPLLDLWQALRPCPACEWRAAAHGGVCSPCRVRWLGATAVAGDASSADVIALGTYRGDLGRLVRAAKYRPDRPLLGLIGTALGHRVRAAVAEAGTAVGCRVVPVPGDAGRVRRRGVDHARVLAAAVATAVGPAATLDPGLRRARRTRPQARLNDAQRRANLEGAIEWRAGALGGATVVLVDDVLTTGATARACRDALADAGAGRVVVAVAARAR